MANKFRFFEALGISFVIALVFTALDYFVHLLIPAIHSVPSYYYLNKIIIVTLITAIILKWLLNISVFLQALIMTILLQLRYVYTTFTGETTIAFLILTTIIHYALLLGVFAGTKFIIKVIKR